MKINGAKYLNKNDYETINIRGSSIGVRGSDKPETIKSTSPFTATLKGLTDEEKIERIIEHFLNYTRVTKLNERAYNLGEKCIEINGSHRLLRLKTNPSATSKRKIMAKYIQDRYTFTSESLENDNEIYVLRTNIFTTGYRRNFEGKIELTILQRNDKTPTFEKEYLSWLIQSISNGKPMRVERIYQKYHDVFEGPIDILDGTYIMINGQKRIQIDGISNALKSEIKELIERENKKINETQSLQLKMEGI